MAKKHCCSMEYTKEERFCSQCGKELREVYQGKCTFQYEAIVKHEELIKKYKMTPEQIQIFRNRCGVLLLEYDFGKEAFTLINSRVLSVGPAPVQPKSPQDSPADDPEKRLGPRESYMIPPKIRKQQEVEKRAKYEKERDKRIKKGYR